MCLASITSSGHAQVSSICATHIRDGPDKSMLDIRKTNPQQVSHHLRTRQD